MAKITSLEDFELYQIAIKLTSWVFEICRDQELKSEFELQNQAKRAAISVASNLAEGFGRRTKKDFAQFLSIALGSANEIQAQLTIISLVAPKLAIQAKKLQTQYSCLGKRLYLLRKGILGK